MIINNESPVKVVKLINLLTNAKYHLDISSKLIDDSIAIMDESDQESNTSDLTNTELFDNCIRAIDNISKSIGIDERDEESIDRLRVKMSEVLVILDKTSDRSDSKSMSVQCNNFGNIEEDCLYEFMRSLLQNDDVRDLALVRLVEPGTDVDLVSISGVDWHPEVSAMQVRYTVDGESMINNNHIFLPNLIFTPNEMIRVSEAGVVTPAGAKLQMISGKIRISRRGTSD